MTNTPVSLTKTMGSRPAATARTNVPVSPPKTTESCAPAASARTTRPVSPTKTHTTGSHACATAPEIDTPVSLIKTMGSCAPAAAPGTDAPVSLTKTTEFPAPPATGGDHSLSPSEPMTEGVEIADGDTVTDERTSCTVSKSGISMDVGKDSALIAEQDESGDEEPSTIPGETACYDGLRARLTTTLQ